MLKIKSSVIESIILAARNTYPDEFLSLLGVDKEGVISELVVLPATYGKRFSSIMTYLIPFDKSIMGSVHSHPSASNRPSGGDLRVFSRLGRIHFIICFPFNLNTIKAYNVKGKELDYETVK